MARPSAQALVCQVLHEEFAHDAHLHDQMTRFQDHELPSRVKHYFSQGTYFLD